VSSAAPTAPRAVATFAPAAPGVGEPVELDGSSSSAHASTSLISYQWRLGDGAQSSGPTTRHSYALGGAYQASLTVHDGLGGSDRASFAVPVSDALCADPPPARIAAIALTGAESLAAELSCADCGDRVVRWSVSDGDSFEGPVLRKTFGPGRYRVRMLALSNAGCRAHDDAEVVVTRGGVEPPRCEASAPATAGPVPFTASLSGWAVDPNPLGEVTELRWLFEDGATMLGSSASRTVERLGSERVQLRATSRGGLTCTDELGLEALDSTGAPAGSAVSHPAALVAECGLPFSLIPGHGGADGVIWSLEQAPDGMSIDPRTGALSWMADAPTRTEEIRVVARAGRITAVQRHTMEVACRQPALFLGCGCDSGAGSGAALLALALLGLRRRRRPAGL
jgi:MYXO-CTERM domain-containing protein